MGQIIKYNLAKSDSDSRKSTPIATTPIISDEGGSIDCELWGNRFRGNDISGTMRINGDIYLDVDSDSDEDDDIEPNDNPLLGDDDGDDEEEITGTLYGNVEGNNVYGIKGFINYPNADGEKSNIADLIKTNADNISTNKTEINNLKTRVSNNETNISNNSTEITNLKTRVGNNETNISNNADEIEKLKGRTTSNEEAIENFDGVTEERVMEILNEWKYGGYSRPVILASGYIRKSSVSTSTNYFWDGSSLDSLWNIRLSHENGLMTMQFDETKNRYTDGKNAHNIIYSVHATQMKSGDSGDDLSNPYIKGRSDGAHWFETRFNNNTHTVYIREFHQGNGDNDTWYSDNWDGQGGGIKEVNITIIGYAYWTEA